MKVLAIYGCVLALPAGLAAQDAGSTIEPEAGVRLFGSVVRRAILSRRRRSRSMASAPRESLPGQGSLMRVAASRRMSCPSALMR